MTLIAQHETQTDDLNRSYGWELFRDPEEDYFTTRFHIRTYHGIKVESSWAGEEVRLDSTTSMGAKAELEKMWRVWLRSINAQT